MRKKRATALYPFTSLASLLWCVALLVGICSRVGSAQTATEVLILPIETPGYQNPVDSESLATALEEELHKRAPGAHLQLGRGADLTAYSYAVGAGLPPSQDSAERMAQAYGARYVTWVSLRFQPDYHGDTGVLALAAAARVWVYDGQSHSVAIDQPLSLVRMGQVAQIHEEDAAYKEGRRLAGGIVADLAGQLVAIAHRSSSRTVAPAWGQSASEPIAAQADITKSRSYKAMSRAANTYLRATKNNNLVDITESKAAMASAWPQLNVAERESMEQNYPGITKLMEEPPAYQYYGPGYWPYRYNYAPIYAPVSRP